MSERLFEKFLKENDVSQQLCSKYETVLPSELIDLWRKYGFGSFMEGYLKIINPEEYQDLLIDTYFRGSVSIPMFITAFGDIITSEEDQYIGIVRYKNGNFNILSRNFKRFLQNLEDEYFQEKYFQIPQYVEAVKRLGEIKHDECFGYVPLLGLGGSEKVENLDKVKIREHIELISRLVGKIGM